MQSSEGIGKYSVEDTSARDSFQFIYVRILRLLSLTQIKRCFREASYRLTHWFGLGTTPMPGELREGQ